MKGIRVKYILLKIIGGVFIFFGFANGYVAFQGLADPEFFIVVNGSKRSDMEAKYLYLALHFLIVLVGVALNFISHEQLAAVQNIRNKFWAIIRK